MTNSDLQNPIPKVLLTALTLVLIAIPRPAASAPDKFPSQFKFYKVLVNSDRDTISPDQELTLREAIAIVNNTLPLSQLSPGERQQIAEGRQLQKSRIEFELPAPVQIELASILPPLVSPGLVIDGTAHPDYDPNSTATVEIPVPIPVVSLTPAQDQEIFRGLTIAGDRIQIKGLSIYGFSQPSTPTDTTPGADIVISSRLPRAGKESQLPVSNHPPQDVAIIDNWLGLPPDESLTDMPDIPSSFGIWLFDGVNTKIKGNRIVNHGGSGILTSTDVRKTKIESNLIVGNGLTGMPHAIYLEGQIQDSQINDNLVCGNDGSGVYLFKPDGSINISRNTIKFNGRRVPSAAVYLTGNDHQVANNKISWQTGTGVTIAAYPQSDRNLIINNAFHDLEGLSIDLNTRNRVSNPFWKLGDGVNPARNSRQRRKDTANRAINAPQFLSDEFHLIDGRVNIDGLADPGAKVSLYQVKLGMTRDIREQSPLPLASQSKNHGPLSELLTEVTTDQEGKFGVTLDNLTPGSIISAIATKPDDGTSEPALNATIKALVKSQAKSQAQSSTTVERSISFPNCTTKPIAEVNEPPVELKVPEPAKPITLRVPRNIHFALDRADISAPSAAVLKQIAAVLKQQPFLTIELQGHTDFRASNQYNLALSKLRAIATRNYLLQQGIDPAGMTIVSLGESQLERSGNSVIEHAYNRRVEVIFRDLRGLEIIIEKQDKDLQLER